MPNFSRHLLDRAETRLSTVLLSTICRTIRMSERNGSFARQRLLREDRGVVFSFWHNRLFYFTYYYATRFFENGGPRLSVMISRSRDGEKIARVAEEFGYHVVRGSTSRRGQEALRKMIRIADRNRPIALTPDGPRGPRYRVQKGPAYLASATGLPIVPISFGVDRFYQFPSWDRFVLPYPFSSGVILCGDPIWPDEESGDVDTIQDRLQEGMNTLDRKLERMGYHFE